MSTIADGDDLRVVAGVDTHKDVHVAVVLDELGRLLDTASFPATARGYRNLTGWVTSFGEVRAIGVEGTGSWGAGLSRHLRTRGLNVIEVNKPNRHNRRRRGKTDRSMPRRRHERSSPATPPPQLRPATVPSRRSASSESLEQAQSRPAPRRPTSSTASVTPHPTPSAASSAGSPPEPR
jgi:transposase